jgi:hypothetical protein
MNFHQFTISPVHHFIAYFHCHYINYVKSSSVYLAVQKITSNFAPLFDGKVCNELEIRKNQ